MPSEKKSEARDLRIRMIRENLKGGSLTADFRNKLERMLAELQGEAKPSTKVAGKPLLPPVKTEAAADATESPKRRVKIWTPDGEIEVLREEPRRESPKADTERGAVHERTWANEQAGPTLGDEVQECARKIKIIQERLKTPMHPDIRRKFEGLLAHLQGVEVKKSESLPLPPVKPYGGPLDTSASGTVKVWTSSGYIEVARSAVPQCEEKALQRGDGIPTIDVSDADKVPRSPAPIPEPADHAAAGEANQVVEQGSSVSEESQKRDGGKAEQTEGRLPDVSATRMEAPQRPAGVYARTQKQLLTLILGTVWIIASGFLSDDLFHFAIFTFPGIAAAALVYAGLSGRFRRSRLIIAAAVAGWVAIVLFTGLHDCCISPAEASRYARLGYPRGLDHDSHQLKTLTAVQFEMFQLSVPGILVGLIALWWLKRNER